MVFTQTLRILKLTRRWIRKVEYRQAGVTLLLFIKAALSDPRAIGAACPSSTNLADAMAAQIEQCGGVVIELGGGTGVITRALLRQGILPEQLIIVESSPVLASHLAREFPNIRVIEGDASQLRQLLGNGTGKVQAVVSSLPMRSLPPSAVRAIMDQVRQLLHIDGTFVQFTYNLRTPSIGRDNLLTHKNSQIIWKNFPPARIDTFSHRPSPSECFV